MKNGLQLWQLCFKNILNILETYDPKTFIRKDAEHVYVMNNYKLFKNYSDTERESYTKLKHTCEAFNSYLFDNDCYV